MDNSSNIQVEQCTVCSGTGREKNGSQQVSCSFCGGSGVFGTDGEIEYLMQLDTETKQPFVLGIRPKGIMNPESSSTRSHPPVSPNWIQCTTSILVLIELAGIVFSYLFLEDRRYVILGSIILTLTVLAYLLSLPILSTILAGVLSHITAKNTEEDFIAEASKRTSSDSMSPSL